MFFFNEKYVSVLKNPQTDLINKKCEHFCILQKVTKGPTHGQKKIDNKSFLDEDNRVLGGREVMYFNVNCSKFFYREM